MWSRLHNQLKQILKKDNSEEAQPSPQQLLQYAIQEIDVSIHKNEKALTELHKNQADVKITLNDFKNKVSGLEMDAKRALEKNKENELQLILKKKSTTEKHYLEYKSIYDNTTKTINQLVFQLDKLKLQRKETKSKEVILKAKLESAQSNLDLNTYLNDLESSHSIELFEDEINRIEIEASLTNEVLSLENEIQELQAQDEINSFKEAVKKEEEEKHIKAQEAQLKRINNIFSRSEQKELDPFNKKQKKLEEAKEKILNNFKQSKKDLKVGEKNQINDFFESGSSKNKKTKEKPISGQNKKSIENFFTDSKTGSPTPKKESGDKQNIIDDFFNS